MLSDEQIKENISVNIMRILDLRGWSQSELSRVSGVPQMTVSAVIRKVNLPGVGIASRLAEALDVTVDRLIAEPPKRNSRTIA